MTAAKLDFWLRLTRDRYDAVPSLARSSRQLAEGRRAILNEVDSQRKRFRSRVGRLWAAQAIDRSMSGVVGRAILGGGEYGQALEGVESLKARVLLDQMKGLEVPAPPEVAGELLQQERDVLRFASSTNDSAMGDLRLLSLLPVGLSWDDADRIQRVEALESAYRSHDAGFSDLSSVPTLADVHNALGPDEGLVEYFIPFHLTHPSIEGLAICVSSECTRVIRLPLGSLSGTGFIGKMSIDGGQPFDASPLTEAIWTTRKAISEGREADATACLEQLWQILILPLLNDWHYPDEHKRWIIIPHGPLHYVPFAALKQPGDDGARLVEDVALTVCPSAAVWVALRQRVRPAPSSFFGVADPLLRNSALPPLKDALKELSNAIKSLKGYEHTSLTADQATETRVRDDVGGKSIVHFGAHGEFPEDDPFDFHRILLTPCKQHDGALHAEELRGMDLRAARLVVLSICDGGLYRFGPGDEPLGLIPALFVAGAENILAPLWAIEDRAARRHTSAFYKGLAKLGPAEALRRACKAAIKKGTELRDWAGFVNSGPGRPFGSA